MPYKLHKIKSIREIVKQQNHLYPRKYGGTSNDYLVKTFQGCYYIKIATYSQSNAPNHLELSAAQWETISNYVLRRFI